MVVFARISSRERAKPLRSALSTTSSRDSAVVLSFLGSGGKGAAAALARQTQRTQRAITKNEQSGKPGRTPALDVGGIGDGAGRVLW